MKPVGYFSPGFFILAVEKVLIEGRGKGSEDF